VGKPTLAARGSVSRIHPEPIPRVLRLQSCFCLQEAGVFPAPPAKLQIATVTMVHVALGTFPETETLMFRQNLSQIHGRPIMGTTDVGCNL
jgi:hypothetical protein